MVTTTQSSPTPFISHDCAGPPERLGIRIEETVSVTGLMRPRLHNPDHRKHVVVEEAP